MVTAALGIQCPCLYSLLPLSGLDPLVHLENLLHLSSWPKSLNHLQNIGLACSASVAPLSVVEWSDEEAGNSEDFSEGIVVS